jgi:peptide-methionine (R)-S-oxide reductase
MELTRREFVFALVASAGLTKWRTSVPAVDVVIVEFSDSGVRLGTVTVPKVVKSDAEWRTLLSPLAFNVARQAGTERPFSGAYWDLHERGLFRCVCCETALFSSAAKFDSGTGWPSFWQPIARENVEVHGDRGDSDPEGEVTCRRCDAHLGDVFADGPRPTGLRYCIDSVALKFVRAG